jgi:hypothetical protein
MNSQYKNERENGTETYAAKAPSHRLLSRQAAMLVLTLAGLIGSFAGDTAPAALAQGVPGGSYQQSCKNHDMAFGHLLYSACRNTAGNFVGSRLRFTFLCSGDISNQDGKLVCAKSAQSPQFKAAVTAFTSASVTVLGRLPKSTGIEESEESASELLGWIAHMHSLNMQQQYQDGTKFSDAVEVIKDRLKLSLPLQQEVIKRAYLEVYGAEPGQAQLAQWGPQLTAKTLWYVPLVAKLNEELNTNKGLYDRRTIIRTVYYLAMGRDPNDGDFNFWQPRKDNYTQMLLANRNWLYSDAGKGDLQETVRRAFKQKMKKDPSSQEVTDTANLFTPKRLIYIEMIK